MHAEVGDRVVLHGRRGTRIGVVVESTEGDEGRGSRVRWADGGESILSTAVESDASEHATWEAAKAGGGAVLWRRGVTAGVGREAALAQEALGRKLAAGE